MEILKDQKIIKNLLNKAVEDILPSKEELRKLLLSGKRLKIYQGFDPTGPSLHIGHAVSMRKLEDFRKLGHEVYFLIGDFTAMIGDPSDKSSTRQKLSREQVLENLKSYKKEASKIVDIDNKENPVKVVFNYEWLSKLTLEDILELSSLFTVQQMIKRDMFQQRLKENKPIYLSEFLYPLMQ
jgi:tyrosyl-tRNA synthetase